MIIPISSTAVSSSADAEAIFSIDPKYLTSDFAAALPTFVCKTEQGESIQSMSGTDNWTGNYVTIQESA